MDKAITYVSLRSLPDPEGAADLQDIVTSAQSRNAALDVTGALLSTTRSFAQFLEGPEAAIDALMERISRDLRHREMKVVSVKYQDQRKFPKWAMAYSGDAFYIEAHVKRLLAPSTPKVEAENVVQLVSLMEEFSKRLA